MCSFLYHTSVMTHCISLHYSKTCLSDHSHRATTSLQRPRQNSPNNSYRKAPIANMSTATTYLMWTTTARTSTQCTNLYYQLRPVGVVNDYCMHPLLMLTGTNSYDQLLLTPMLTGTNSYDQLLLTQYC